MLVVFSTTIEGGARMARAGWLAFAALLSASMASAREAARVDPAADVQLRRMSDYLASLRSFQFDALAVDEAVGHNGQKIQFIVDQQISVRRPDRLRTDRRGPLADLVFRYDGAQFSVYGKRNGYYALAAAPAKLDAAIDAARDTYGIDAPGADLLLSDPYAELMPDVIEGRYIGMESIDGVRCHHIAYRAKDVDWQLWIEDGAQPLPRRYQITSKTEPGQPEFALMLSRWKTNAVLPDSLFSFEAPPGSKQIPFRPPGRYQGKR
jgi:hypothetical protein